MSIKSTNEKGSALLMASLLMVSLTTAMGWYSTGLRFTLKSVRMNDNQMENREGDYNWVRYMLNNGSCNSLTMTMTASEDPDNRVKINPNYDPSSNKPQPILKAEQIYGSADYTVDFVELNPPSGLSRFKVPLLSAGESTSSIGSFEFRQEGDAETRTSTGKRGLSTVVMNVYTNTTPKRTYRWKSNMNVFYSTQTVTIRGITYDPYEVVECFGWETAAYMCTRTGDTWDISDQHCIPDTGEFWQP